MGPAPRRLTNDVRLQHELDQTVEECRLASERAALAEDEVQIAQQFLSQLSDRLRTLGGLEPTNNTRASSLKAAMERCEDSLLPFAQSLTRKVHSSLDERRESSHLESFHDDLHDGFG